LIATKHREPAWLADHQQPATTWKNLYCAGQFQRAKRENFPTIKDHEALTMNHLSVLSNEANEHHAAAQEKAGQAVTHAMEAGRLLAAAKQTVKHGEWADWLKANFIGSDRHARRYMKLHQSYAALPESKRPHVANLPSLRQALEAVADEPQAPAIPQWLPTGNDIARALLSDDIFIDVQQPLHAPGYFQFLVVNGQTADYLKRGIQAKHLEQMIIDLLPHGLTKGQGLASKPWEYTGNRPNYLAQTIQQLDATR
jgi:hypothetical protein